jgi:cytochrome b subunit of formate dehydrogenase
MAPDCTTCHGTAHEVVTTNTVEFRSAVPDTCGACHSEVADEYRQSVHGQAIARGVVDAPVCTDCHGGHSILAPTNVASTVYPTHVRETCASCHANVRLTQRFGLPGDRIISFDASFHGLAAKAGNQTVANCASCHGVHNIFPSADPRSTIHPRNLAVTCGKCHLGAGKRFALGRVHLLAGENGEPRTLRWIREFYLIVIPLVVGFMLLHNLGDWLHKLQRLRFASVPPGPGVGFPQVGQEIRMYPFERLEHAILAGSFIMLAWTGFALRYPDQWWAKPLLIWEVSHSTRGMIHRAASVLFMSAGLAHIVSLITSKRLREHWKSLWPHSRDLRIAGQQFAFNLGLRQKAPAHAAHGYVEKIEYWALIWGSVIMVLTGSLLWANGLVLKFMPKLILDIATSLHFYEAVLATLAILIWHFYFVIFDPDVYPMDTAWLVGKSPRSEHHSSSAEQEFQR